MRYLLQAILEGVYESKLVTRFTQQLIDDAINQGFAERYEKLRDFAVQGIRITASGRTELQRLESEANTPPQPTAEQLRYAELKLKLKDDSITDAELKELLKILFRV